MAVPLKFFLILSLVSIAATRQLKPDYIHDPGETPREYIREQIEMKKLLKEEMQKMFATMKADHRELSESVSSLTTALFPPTLTEVEEVNAEIGTIEFTGGTNPHVRTKIWILQSKGGTWNRYISFVLEENGLREDARLSLWGSGYSSGKQETWTGSQGDWQAEKESAGHVILVTLRISAGGAERPSFKLKFNSTSIRSRWVCSSQLVTGEGRQEVSFPPNNTANYPPWTSFVAVVAPPRGGFFGLTLKFVDLPGIPPDDCDNNKFFVWFLEESSTGLPFTRLPRRCGRDGAISEPLGNSTVAILQLYTGDKHAGRGFRVQIN